MLCMPPCYIKSYLTNIIVSIDVFQCIYKSNFCFVDICFDKLKRRIRVISLALYVFFLIFLDIHLPLKISAQNQSTHPNEIEDRTSMDNLYFYLC